MLVFCKCISLIIFSICWADERSLAPSLTTGNISTAVITATEVISSTSDEAIVNITTSASPRSPATTSSKRPFGNHDFVLTEIIRLVFQGSVGTAGFPNTVYGLIESFLTRATRELKAEDGSDWSYELSSTLQPINYENITTFMDFRIKHTAQKAISSVFDRLDLRRFVSQNSHLVLLVECWPHRNCQNGSMTVTPQQTVLEKNLNLVTTIIVLCSLCLVIILTGVVCSCLKRMETSKQDTDFETKDFADNSKRILVKQNSSSEPAAVPSQAVQETSFYASAADEDEDVETLHRTWVIPLDEAPGGEAAVIVVTTEDTKL